MVPIALGLTDELVYGARHPLKRRGTLADATAGSASRSSKAMATNKSNSRRRIMVLRSKWFIPAPQ
jgi:hypothetical protein